MSHKKAREEILLRMESELSSNLHYHSIDHTLGVMTAIEEIVQHEKVTAEELDLLLTAAAYHDCGFISSYHNHEAGSCAIMKVALKEHGIDDETIDQIAELIMATKVPQQPKSRLARILCDADLYYLGGSAYKATSNKLYRELNENGFPISDFKWLNTQINFLTVHQYWTSFALTELNPVKQKVLRKLLDRKAEVASE